MATYKRSRATGSGRGGRRIGTGYSKPAKARDSYGKSRVGNPPLSSWSKHSRKP